MATELQKWAVLRMHLEGWFEGKVKEPLASRSEVSLEIEEGRSPPIRDVLLFHTCSLGCKVGGLITHS